MNIKNKLFLAFSLLSMAGITHSMDLPEQVTYRTRTWGDGTTVGEWHGKLANGKYVTALVNLDGPHAGEIQIISTDFSHDYSDPVRRREAVDYMKNIYEPGNKLTQ